MRKMFLFMMVSLDGFMEGPGHDLSWHHVDDEFNDFAARQMQEMGMILFGRRTYELMRDFWPTYKPEDKTNTIIKKQMDILPKIVFSKGLQSINQDEHENWQHVKLLHNIDIKEIKKLKQNPPSQSYGEVKKDIAVLGSNNLCVSLLELGLLDELRIMINPVVIGKGTLLFQGLKGKLPLKLFKTKTFKNGNVLLYYQPVYS